MGVEVRVLKEHVHADGFFLLPGQVVWPVATPQREVPEGEIAVSVIPLGVQINIPISALH